MSSAETRPGPYRVMTVCTGNICRSPMAEVVLRDRFEAAGLGDRVVVETETGSVLLSAALVYLVPLLLFFLGWFGFAALSWAPGLGGGIGFLLGIVPVLLRNRSLRRRIQFRIVRCVEDG